MNKMHSLKEMSDIHGVSERTLRYYDEEGLLIAERNDQNHRIYTDHDGIRLECIIMLKQIGLSIMEIKQFLSEKGDKEIFQQIVQEKRKQLSAEMKTENEKYVQLSRLEEAFTQGKIETTESIQELTALSADKEKAVFSFWNFLHMITYARVLIGICIVLDVFFAAACLGFIIHMCL